MTTVLPTEVVGRVSHDGAGSGYLITVQGHEGIRCVCLGMLLL